MLISARLITVLLVALAAWSTTANLAAQCFPIWDDYKSCDSSRQKGRYVGFVETDPYKWYTTKTEISGRDWHNKSGEGETTHEDRRSVIVIKESYNYDIDREKEFLTYVYLHEKVYSFGELVCGPITVETTEGCII